MSNNVAFTEEQKKIAKHLASGALIYQADFTEDPIYKEQFKDTPEGAYVALKLFLKYYAYARNVSVPAYPLIAEAVIEKIFGKKIEQITPEDADEAWKRYKEIAKENYNDLKLNPARNPMNFKHKEKSGVLKKLAENKILNIARYIKTKIEGNAIEEAYTFLSEICGIDTKIASFYLRDIAYLAKIDETKINDAHLLQPIDTWLDQTLKIIFEDDTKLKDAIKEFKAKILKEEKRDSTTIKQKIIVGLCKEAECSSIEFNQGAWFIGSQIAGDFSSFEKIAKGSEDAKSIIKEHIQKKKNELLEVEKWLRSWEMGT